ncbi:MAG TPA: hypothetical protein DCL35_08220 [Candidatus Omnitrophica bacterium]|nr:hypothetical protein [Candidatus Omnitrophota bacterium]
MKNRAFSLTELLVGLVIGAIIVLIIASIARIGGENSEQLRKRSQVYNDIFFAFDLMKRRVAEAGVVNAYPGNNTLEADNFRFQRYNSSALIYRDTNDGTDHTILDGVNNLSFTVSLINGSLVTVSLSGGITFRGRGASYTNQDISIPFDLTASFMRRN